MREPQETDTGYIELRQEWDRRLALSIRLIIAGGRDFTNQDIMIDAINKLAKDWDDGDVVIITGMAKGADMAAYNLAKGNGIPLLEFPAEWKDMSGPCVCRVNAYGEYNALAGNKRNSKMREVATHLLAFWDGKSTGTMDMINQSNHYGLDVTIVRY